MCEVISKTNTSHNQKRTIYMYFLKITSLKRSYQQRHTTGGAIQEFWICLEAEVLDARTYSKSSALHDALTAMKTQAVAFDATLPML